MQHCKEIPTDSSERGKEAEEKCRAMKVKGPLLSLWGGEKAK